MIFLKLSPDTHLCPLPYPTGLVLGFIHKARSQRCTSYSESCGWHRELSSNCQSRTCPPAQQGKTTLAYFLCRVCAAQALEIPEDIMIFCHCCYQHIQQQKAWLNAQDCLATPKSQDHFNHTWISSLPERLCAPRGTSDLAHLPPLGIWGDKGPVAAYVSRGWEEHTANSPSGH